MSLKRSAPEPKDSSTIGEAVTNDSHLIFSGLHDSAYVREAQLVKSSKPSKTVEWHPKLSHFEENLHPNLSHPNRLSCLIFEQGWARSDQRGNFEQITQTCPSRQGLHPTS
jgi:hypothetical protein